MAIYWTVEILRAQYEVLRHSLPFKRWGLPHADWVEFHVGMNPSVRGEWSYDRVKKRHIICISNPTCQTFPTMIRTMMHEMCHMRQHMLGERSEHGRVFNLLADQVCKRHGFERGMF